MKLTASFLFLGLFLLLFNNASQAQSPITGAEIRAAVNRASMHSMHTMQIMRMNHMFYYGTKRVATKKMPVKGKYRIVFKDGSEDIVETRILSDKGKHYFSYKVFGEKVTVYPEDTQLVVRLWGEFEIKGEPKGDHWLFQTIVGSINGYSKLPNATGGKSLLYIQKGDGELLPFNSTNVLEFVRDQDSENEALSKGDYIGAIVEYNQKCQS